VLECQKERFALPPGLHYLNCAYMGPLARRVEAAGIAGIRRRRDPSGISPEHFFEESDRVRLLFARLIGAREPERIAILPAVSYGVAIAARNTPVARGQNLVVAHEQFPSNVYAWRALAARTGAELRTVAPAPGPSRGAAWTERILEAVDADTAVVALDHVHWTDGTRFDLESIGARAREVGAAFVVDGTQSVGALPFDVERIRPDALVCAAYKWLLGPYGIALAYFGPRYDDGVPLEETWIARAGSEDFRGLVRYRDEYRPGAARYDVGERSNFILLPMLVAALEDALEWGPAAVEERARALTAGLLEELRARGFALEDDAWRAAHLFGLRPPAGFDVARLEAALREHRVVASWRGSALRISVHVFNDEDDVAALAAALREAQ